MLALRPGRAVDLDIARQEAELVSDVVYPRGSMPTALLDLQTVAGFAGIRTQPALRGRVRSCECVRNETDTVIWKDNDTLFLEIALEKGLLAQEQVRELHEAVATLGKIGIERTLAQIAEEKRTLSRAQLDEIRSEMRKRGVLPRFGGYEIISKLGEGGMGTVSKARHLALDRIVALKVLPAELARDRSYVKRFVREARLAARVSHTNLVQVYDVGASEGRHYIAMEFVSGGDVTKLLKSGPIPEARALKIVLGVARGLQEAHDQGFVHRDIKPGNIMLTEKGVPKVTDLGLARDMESRSAALTRSNLVMGTPHYMAPEQCLGEKDIDGRADIYSLGATLFYMVCGRVPFRGESSLVVIEKQVKESLPDPRSLRPDLSDGTVALIRRMMEKDRARRFQNCAEVIAAIEEVRRGGVPRAEAPLPAVSSPAPVGPQSDGATDASVPGVSEQVADEGPHLSPGAVAGAPTARWKGATRPQEVLPPGWTPEERLVKVATPEGDIQKDITYYTNTISMELVRIPPGEFIMGSPDDEDGRNDDEGPQHRVRITTHYYLGAYAVTQAEYEKVTGRNPACFKGARNPVEQVSWKDAVEFCKRLSEQEGVPYRLPTEAEWEYACRAGTTTPFNTGRTIAGDQANYDGKYSYGHGRPGVQRDKAVPVGSFNANGFGLHDMHGNVWEACGDLYDEDYYRQSEVNDPKGPGHGDSRVLRGGSWYNRPAYCRSASRVGYDPEHQSFNTGFRVVCAVRPEAEEG